MKCNIIKKTMFFAINENGKKSLLNGNYHTYEEIEHENVELDVDTIGEQPSKLSKEDEQLISDYFKKQSFKI